MHFFYSHLNYCSHIWCNTFITKFNKINILQKRAHKYIYNNDKMYRKLYIQHNSLKFTDSVKLNTSTFMFRARNHSLPSNLQNLFMVKAYDTLLFHRIIIRTKRKLCLSSSGPRLCKKLKKSLRIKNSIYAFNTNYKKGLIHFYDDN